MNINLASVTLVEEINDIEEIEVRIKASNLPMARHHAECYCKSKGIKIVTRIPKIGRIASDKNNVVWHVIGL